MFEEIDSGLGQMQQGKLGQLRNATRLALEHRRRVKAGDLSVFLLPLAMAIAKDGLFDPISDIPILGLVVDLAFSFPISIYLFIFMWGRGKWKLKLLAFVITFVGNIPVLDLLPFESFCVLYAYHLAKRDAEEAGVELTRLNQALPRLADDLRGLARQRERVAQAAAEAAPENTASEEIDESEPASEAPGRSPQLPMAQLSEAVSAFRSTDSMTRAVGARSTRAVSRNPAGPSGGRMESGRPVGKGSVYQKLGESVADEAVLRIQAAASRLSQVSSARNSRPLGGQSPASLAEPGPTRRTL